MNPTGLFGRPQGGAFQANGAQSLAAFTFGQAPAFGQGAGQTSRFSGTPAFGQTSSVFGQSSGTASGQTPAFGLTGSGNHTPAFGHGSTGFGPTLSFTQSDGHGQNSIFNQGPAFSQTSAFGQTSGFAQQMPGFGLSSTISPSSSVTPSSVSSPPLRFGQPSSSQTSVFTSVGAQGIIQGRGFGISECNFKPSDAALFKPIFNTSPEPASSQAGSMSFCSTQPVTATSMDSSGPGPDASGFPLLSTTTTGPMGFRFSQPAVVPSVSVSSGGFPAKDTLPSTTQEYTFSQPAAPCGGSGSGGGSSQATLVTSSPSFRFSTAALQDPRPLFDSFGQTSAFGQLKPRTEATSSEGQKVAVEENPGETVGKGTKRKEETAEHLVVHGNTMTEEPQARTDSPPRHQPKRAYLRTRGPMGVFRNALTSLMKSRPEPKKGEEQQVAWGEAGAPSLTAPPPAHLPSTPPRSQAPIREVLERAEEMDPEPKATSPLRHACRIDSVDSLGGMSPSEATAIHCKNVPAINNNKEVLRKHFSQFGKVLKVFCRPQKNLAIVHFHDHASAAKAKKSGKLFHKHELTIFLQRKKQSPVEKGQRPPDGPDPASESMDSRLGYFESPPLRKTLCRPTSTKISSSTLPRGSPAKKLPVTKSLQFDDDPQLEAATETPGTDRQAGSLPSSLFHLIGQMAETAEEKYRLLEQRDKILRQARPKRTDLDLSKVFVGTCPDMCPEKERYMRETRNQLSSFEVIPDTEKVEHAAAIKEYSRSSADQEEPLPHELRPLSVLNMTMDYLVTQIMDQGEDNFRDWYDFVWNRTRGIRKDITQQHLSDPLTVSLIEKCTRFHIHCAHHLCQENMMTFDAKINNENMTKCLQSLKEMYLDLAAKNLYCPHEAEFRQYSVLLNLNDGDILREVQQFREELRNSPEVKFAVQAFAALNSNNFVRFFKLVKVSSYLAGCILHRYFTQVRREALRALNMAYTASSRGSTMFPIDDLVRMLMFQNATEAADFVQQYGLNIDSGMVELNRTSYQDPEIPLRPKRSAAIMKKRMMLVGQVVNGAPLPSPPQHVPVCSFDSRNKYRGDGLLASGGTLAASLQGVEVELPKPECVEAGAPPPESLPAAPPTPPLPEPVYSEQDLVAEVEAMVEEVVKTATAEMAVAGADYISTALSVCDSQVEAVMSEVVEQVLREVSAGEIQAEREWIAEEKRKMEEARRKQEHEELLAQVSKALCSEITLEVLRECMAKTAAEEIRHAQEERAACMARCSQDVCGTLVEETLRDELTLLAQEILDEKLLCIRRFIKRWRDMVAVHRQLKRQMRCFPAAPCFVDPHFKLQALAPSAPPTPCLVQLARGVVSLGHAGDLSVSCTRLAKMRKEVLHQMKVHYFYQQLLSESVWTPLDLPALVAANISNPPDTIFWKVVLLLPSNHESDASIANRILTDWLEAKFEGSEKWEDKETVANGHMQTLSVSNGLRDVGENTHRVHVCVKVARGPLSEEGQAALEKHKVLMGTSALLMLLPSVPDDEDEGDVFLLSALLQLRQIQQASAWPQALPLVVVVPGQAGHRTNDERLEEDLKLRMLIEDGLISEYMFLHIPETTNDLQGSKQVHHATAWLAARSPAQVRLTSGTLLQFVEAGLSREFTSRLHHDRRVRQEVGLPPQQPGPIIGLYNAVLTFLAHLVSSPDLASLSWPVVEFSEPGGRDRLPHLLWNCAEHLEWLCAAVLSLQLPDWELPSTRASWPQLVTSIFQYVSQIPWSGHSRPLLMSQLENLLERQRQDCAGLGGGPDREPTFWEVPWDEIVVLCIEHQLRDWSPPRSPVSEDVISDDEEIPVYFQSDGLDGFIPPPYWLEAVKQTHRDKQQEKPGCYMTSWSHQQMPQPSLQQKLCNAIKGPESRPHVSDVSSSTGPQDLLASIEEEKAQSRRFEEQLCSWLDSTSLDSSATSYSSRLFLPSSLLSIPEMVLPSPKMVPLPKLDLEKELVVHSDRAMGDLERGAPVSMARRLWELEQLISASREEELACELKLSCLLDIVDD